MAELGDSLFSLLCMANEMGVDVEDVLRAALARYRRGGRGSVPCLIWKTTGAQPGPAGLK